MRSRASIDADGLRWEDAFWNAVSCSLFSMLQRYLLLFALTPPLSFLALTSHSVNTKEPQHVIAFYARY